MEIKKMDKPKLVTIYARISKKEENIENQLRDLREYCEKQGWQIYKEFQDIVTGREIREEKRPGFTELFKEAHQRKFDIVLFWDLSRFSRAGTLYTLQKLQELRNLGIDWVSYQEPYISSLGQFADIVISIMATLAKIEREKISDRTKTALKRIAEEIKQGKTTKRLGRPPKLCERGHKLKRTYRGRQNGKTIYGYVCELCQ